MIEELYVDLEDMVKGTLTENEQDVNESLDIYGDYDEDMEEVV